MLSKTLRIPARALRARAFTPASHIRAFSVSPIARGAQEITREAIDTPLSLWNFTEEENMLRETGRSGVSYDIPLIDRSKAVCTGCCGTQDEGDG